jgi:DNA (cytosine-5)-methyltransferase 1
MRSLSLFSGIGGFDLGLERAGFEIVAQCECEPFPRAVLARHWPDIPCYDDVTTLDADTLPPDIECVFGGFPCQDISVAGRGEGIEGSRSGLWAEMERIIGSIRPRWVIAENVPALRTRGADRVLGDLEGQGYTGWPIVVGADNAGAPHRRKRVFIVAHTNSYTLREQRQRTGGEGAEKAEPARAVLGDAACIRCQRVSRTQQERAAQPGQWNGWPSGPSEEQHEWEESRLTQFEVGRSADGIPERLVRSANRQALRAYGNAVVPQVAEVIGRAVMAVENKELVQ